LKQTSKDFLQVLFNENEEICISPNKFAFSSVPQNKIEGEFEIVSQNKDRDIFKISEEDILLVAMNPIKGDRSDRNCTALRTFLVEIDDGDVFEQQQYIKSLNMPYTVCVFSGNKSLHYGITLSEDLPNLEMWKDINEWVLAVVSKADQACKNPSRSIRFPDNKRTDGNQLIQKLIDIKNRIDLDVLIDWLDQWPDKNPRIAKAKARNAIKITPTTSVELPFNAVRRLNAGVGAFGPRNTSWFQIMMDLAKAGYSEESITGALQFYFTPEHDFTFREWAGIAKSVVKRVSAGYGD
jgi:hypothetical protein